MTAYDDLLAKQRNGFHIPTEPAGRCGRCGYHVPTQQHRDGCPADRDRRAS
jgi:hypothetical protein